MFGIDRQVYYRSIERVKKRKTLAEQVVQWVEQVRIAQPRIGVRKLYLLLFDRLKAIKVGRDKFFDILRANHLLIIPRRSYHVTTWSHHRFRKHPNLIKDIEIEHPEKVWVSDITYLGKRDKPRYLSLITDAYSKKIVGHYLSESLSTEGCLKALSQAHRNRSYPSHHLIHHSDRGIQYCSDDYQNKLLKHKIKCSMTQDSDPYENAVAERVNGILKQEFMIDRYDLDLSSMKKIVNQAIAVYNNQRPHYSNHMLTPNQMHNQSQLKMRTYKSKRGSETKFTTSQ